MSFDHKSHAIPFDLEAPTPIMFWDPLEFVLAVSFLGFGMIFDVMLIGLVGAVAVLMGSKYLKRGSKRGAMQHMIWNLGLQVDTLLVKRFPPAWKNDFTE